MDITASPGLGWGSGGRQILEKQSKGQSTRAVCESLSKEVRFEQRRAGTKRVRCETVVVLQTQGQQAPR